MDSLGKQIYATFIEQDRYLFFLDGLKTTLILTFSSFLLGTVIGIGLCAAMRSRYAVVRRLAELVRTFFMEMPTMVLLMILVYIVFGSTALPVLWIVIVGLTIRAGAFLSEIFGSSLSKVAPGEIEAARTLGMTRWQAFRYVALPQTVTAALPLYQNQFIATMQETSVVGYLAIIDMTRAASIVSSRTMDAFFGLVFISIVYFLIGLAAKLLLRLAGSHFNKGGAAA